MEGWLVGVPGGVFMESRRLYARCFFFHGIPLSTEISRQDTPVLWSEALQFSCFPALLYVEVRFRVLVESIVSGRYTCTKSLECALENLQHPASAEPLQHPPKSKDTFRLVSFAG